MGTHKNIRVVCLSIPPTCSAWCESNPLEGSSIKTMDGDSSPIICRPIASLLFSPPEMPVVQAKEQQGIDVLGVKIGHTR